MVWYDSIKARKPLFKNHWLLSASFVFSRKKKYTLYKNIRRILESEDPSAKGVEFESLVLLSITRLFRSGKALDEVFQFVGPTPDWARQKAQIVVRMEDGTLGAFDLADGEPENPSGAAAFYAENPDDVRSWIESTSTGWCVPSRFMGPDLLTRIRLANGRLLLVAFQTKCHINGRLDSLKAACTAEAIQQLNPNNFFQISVNSFHRVSVSVLINLFSQRRKFNECSM
jgi:hypothetical protein